MSVAARSILDIVRHFVSVTLEKVRLRRGGFQGWSQHFGDSGGRVVIVSSGQEGAGTSSAVGQTSSVHGASRTLG